MFRDENGQQTWFKSIQSALTLDGRSLAAARIFTGIILLINTLTRWPHLQEFYSDAGTLNRENAKNVLNTLHRTGGEFCWSILQFSGDLWWAQTCSVFLIALSIALIIGFKTRIATVLCWILLVSFHHRNPITLSEGDTVLRLTLFWFIWIPAGKYWSADRYLSGKGPEISRFGEDNPHGIFSIGTSAWIIQWVVLHLGTGFSRANARWMTESGDGFSTSALASLAANDSIARPWLNEISDISFVMNLISFLTPIILIAAAILTILPWRNSWWRWPVLICLGIYYILWALGFHLGTTHWIHLACLVSLAPASIWDSFLFAWIQPSWRSESEENMATVVREESFRDYQGGANIVFSAFCGFLIVLITTSTFTDSNSHHSPVRPQTQTLHQQTVSGSESGLKQILFPKPFRWLLYSTATYQHFGRFADGQEPIFWVTYKAKLKNGSEFDLQRIAHHQEERPNPIITFQPNQLRKNYHLALSDPRFKELRISAAEYYRDRWNSQNREDKKVDFYQVVYHELKVDQTAKEPAKRTETNTIWFDSLSRTKKAPESSFMEAFENRFKNQQ